MDRGDFLKYAANLISNVVTNPNSRVYRIISRKLVSEGLDFTRIGMDPIDHYPSSIWVHYKIDSKNTVKVEIKIDPVFYKNSCTIKIDYKAGSFRRKLVQAVDASGETQWYFEKELNQDLGFQKAFWLKVIPELKWRVNNKISESETKKKDDDLMKDMVRQFPDFEISKRYCNGWLLDHKTTGISIEMTKELDIQQINIPTHKFTTYPDDEFMANLLALFEERVVSTSDNNA